MTLITVSQAQDGVTGVNAASLNTPINTIVNDYNGKITDANIASNAAIAGSKVSYVSVANPYKFSVFRTSAMTSASSPTVVPFDTKTFDTGSNVDIVTNKGRFTAPVAGFYWFAATCGDTAANATAMFAYIYKNGALALAGNGSFSTTGTGTICTVSGIVQMSAGDFAETYFVGGNGSTMAVGVGIANFCGFLISAT